MTHSNILPSSSHCETCVLESLKNMLLQPNSRKIVAIIIFPVHATNFLKCGELTANL